MLNRWAAVFVDHLLLSGGGMNVVIKQMLLGAVIACPVAVMIVYTLFLVSDGFFPCVNSESCIMIKTGMVIFFGSLFATIFSTFLARRCVHNP